MKTITLILTPLLFILELNAKDVSSNSTFHQYSKPGAPIDMSYSSQKVDINETCDVNITLTTAINKGTVSILIHLDKKLNSLTEFDNNISFEIIPNEQNFAINLQIESQQQGLYYIRLLTKVDQGYGVKLRSFAVPIYIGKEAGIKNKDIDSQMKALNSAENISVSKVIEVIETVKSNSNFKKH